MTLVLTLTTWTCGTAFGSTRGRYPEMALMMMGMVRAEAGARARVRAWA